MDNETPNSPVLLHAVGNGKGEQQTVLRAALPSSPYAGRPGASGASFPGRPAR